MDMINNIHCIPTGGYPPIIRWITGGYTQSYTLDDPVDVLKDIHGISIYGYAQANPLEFKWIYTKIIGG